VQRPILLLLLVGLLLAVNIALAKTLATAGLFPLLAAFAATAGAGVGLLAAAFVAGQRPKLGRDRLLFYVAAGGVSYALPNALVFSAAARVGSSYATVLHAFVPVLTYLIAMGWGMDKLKSQRALGLALGLTGALIVVLTRFGFSTSGEGTWLLLSLVAPVSIAFGNVLRSRYWPQGASPLEVGSALLLAAGAQLGLALAFMDAGPMLDGSHAGALALLLATSTLFYGLYFRLQHIAGPVYLSQIGFVGGALGLPLGVVMFAEQITVPMLAGIALVLAGVLLVRPAPTAAAYRSPGERTSSPEPERSLST